MNERKETPSNSNSSSTGEHSKFLFSLYSQFLLLLKVSAESEERVEGEKKKGEDDDRVDCRRRISDSFVCSHKGYAG